MYFFSPLLKGFVNLRPRWPPMSGQMTSPNGRSVDVRWMWRPWKRVDMAMQLNTWSAK